ncbi:MAG: UDP-N-acetylmuramoyl-L-alanine--D-glutamate ligase [Gammaproteobacteria bacterium]|nr:MAG: UDP-N-acetylmuramoyl-L-alanine--D-glutamate ligase [Gammaproteobacteria bacterium]UCH41592.1 MAG: UDP-N-acetylmuramoyl-L-alanine--D-glutamate ligase [Gammaproteobacteria bacterium]
MLNVKQQSTALADVNYLVVGLGLSGYSVAIFLLEHGYRCRVQDTREQPPCLGQLKARFEQVDFHCGEINAELTGWADAIVVSPGLSARQPQLIQAAEQGKAILGDVELFARLADAPVVAITGSNGKSTVTTLVGAMIARDNRKVAVGGNIGTPALELLEQKPEFYVLELSSYQLETTTSLAPRVAALLNLCEDHLDRYDDYADYIDAKRRIYRNAGLCVSNLDDVLTHHDDNDLRFSLDPSSVAQFRLLEDGGFALGRGDEAWISVDELKVSGRHNWANCLAAMAIADGLGISREAIVEAMREFGGIPHRSQWVAEIDGVEWINDSKATNVGAAKASIEGRERPVILIAGGQSKGADMSVMTDAIRARVKRVLLLGEDAGRLQQAWQGACEIERVGDMAAAVRRAREVAVSGDCVLLAPACASFDMYDKFERRGEHFMQLVRELADD